MCPATLSRSFPVLAYSDGSGEHTFMLSTESATIGRLGDQDLVLPDSYVSRRHALIRRVDAGYELLDRGSTHGTYVNGARVERAFLRAGDIVQFGSLSAVKFRFDVPSIDESRPHPSLADELLTAMAVFSPSMGDARPAVREMEQLSFLISAARELNSGGAITDILRVLLQSAIKLTGAERGFVFLREQGEMTLALGLRADGTPVDEDSTVSRRAMQKAIASESKFSLSDTLADDSASAWASVVANSIRSIYCIPLRKHVSPAEPSRLLGLLYLDSQIGSGHLTEIDHQVLEMVAAEAATLLDNALMAEAEIKARRAAEELAVAAKIHSSLMSITLPTLPYAVMHARTVPCLAIGGDFFDAIALDECVYVVIADVSGKGVPAAIVAATLQGIIHSQLLTRQSLVDIADLVNRFLCTRNVDKYATMIMLKLCPDGTLEYLNCGHVPPMLVNSSGVTRLEEYNLIVGLIPGATYESAVCHLKPGDRILLTTDGVTEAENLSREMFGDERLDSVAASGGIDTILDQLAEFQRGVQAQDDWTLFDIRYHGPATAN